MSAPSNNFSPGNTVEPPNNPGTFIGKLWRAKICGWLTCLINPKIRAVVIPSDGSPQITTDAEIIMAANGWTATLDLTKVAGVGGGGSALELTDGTTDLNGVSKITVTGATVGGTSAAATLAITGGGYRGEYDPTASYAVQDYVVIRSGSNMGTFVCIQANSAQAPQLPDTGNLYWVCISNSQAQWM